MPRKANLFSNVTYLYILYCNFDFVKMKSNLDTEISRLKKSKKSQMVYHLHIIKLVDIIIYLLDLNDHFSNSFFDYLPNLT